MNDTNQNSDLLSKRQTIDSKSFILLDNKEKLFLITEGKVDLFLVKIEDGVPAGHRDFFYSLSENNIINGFKTLENNDNLSLIGVTRDKANFAEIDKDTFLKSVNNKIELFEKAFDDTIKTLYGSIIPFKEQRKYRKIGDEETITLEKDELFLNDNGVKWIKHLEGESTLFGIEEIALKTGDDYFALSQSLYLKSVGESKIQIRETKEIIEEADFYERITQTLDTTNRIYLKRINETAKEEKERILKKINQENIILKNSLHSLSEVMNPKSNKEERIKEDELIGSLRVIGKHLNTEIKIPQTNKINLESLVNSSNLQMRQVVLKNKWWTSDNGILLAFLEKKDKPVVLIPSPYDSYKIFNYSTGETEKVTSQNADLLKSHAFTFYKPLPNKKLGIKDLVDYALSGIWKFDIVVLLLSGLVGGLISVIFPIMTGLLFNSIIPSAERNGLLYVGILLFVCISSGLIFQLTKIFTLLRIETKMDCSLQAAVWDRLINLPSTFFKNFSAGDLAQRANGISLIRRELSGGTITSVLSAFFSIFNLILLFFYSASLAWISIILVIISIALTLTLGYLSTTYQRKMVDVEGKISGMLLQIINGIAKFKVSGSEERAFALWAAEFSKKRKYEYKSDLLSSYLNIFNIVYPIITSMLLFFFVSLSGNNKMSIGNFIAFTASFSAFMTAMMELSRTLIDSLNIIPLYERAKPILETLPERDETKSDPGSLEGDIDVSHITFRYSSDSPAILKDLSLKIQSGEFVAFVGPSGSGKSTLMRLLLGFEKAESGVISIDGQDISTVDLREIRKQMGVVLQNGKIMAGDIFSNIVGSSVELTLDDAWRAAEMAGLSDDINDMPMGMHTVISEGGGTLSGGQRQRLLIARAIVKKPKILLFDEATSALDNKTQALISKSIENLNSTRIVIAHRLSTIIKADKIFVLVKGNLVEEGTYDELITKNGFFTELAKRQIA